MKTATLRAARLRSHRLAAPARSVTDAATHMLAVQSQDFIAGRWALAARTRGDVGLAAVDRAFGRGDLVRSWTMRGTLHVIPSRDLDWVLSVTGDRQLKQAATRHRQLGIDDALLDVARRAIAPALRDGGVTRAEAFALWEAAGIDPRDQRGVHLLCALSILGEICQGPVVEAAGVTREQRFVPVDAWIADAVTPDDPMAELFVRYIDGHGPAGVADFAWWSGLTLRQSREAAERAAGRVDEVEEGLFAGRGMPRRSANAASVHVLPAFDEYYISYADRTAVCAPEHLALVGPGKNGMVRATIVENGRVIGCWTHAAAALETHPELFEAPDDADAVSAALARFREFLHS